MQHCGENHNVVVLCPQAQLLMPPADPPTPLAAKGLLRSIDHVEEAIFIPLLLVNLRDGSGYRHHAVLVHQQEKGLCGVQLQTASDNFDKLTHVDMVWHQKLCLVQNRKLLLPLISLNNYRDLVGMLLPDLLDLLAPVSKCPPLFEGSIGRHHCLCNSTDVINKLYKKTVDTG